MSYIHGKINDINKKKGGEMNMDETTTNTNGSKMNPMMIVGIVVVIAVVGYVVMMKNKNTSQTQPTEITQQEEPTAMETTPVAENPTGAMEEKGAVKTITMEAGSFYYKPNVINVAKGTKIKVVMTSKDMMHNFNIDEFKVKSETAKAGTSTTFEFTASKAGTFEYYCSIGRHRQNGQVGKLVVK